MNMTHKRAGALALMLALLLCLCACSAAPASAMTAAADGGEPSAAPIETEAPAQETPAAEDAAVRTVDAATVNELLKAIAPNTVVNLTGRSYDLTDAQGYGVYGSKYYHWNEIYDDGWELEIEGVEGLTIRAARPGTEIVTVPRYADVLRFTDCRDLTLEGFTAGHSEGAGYCTGAVVGLDNCRDVRVDRCDLYGCGTYGLEIVRSSGVKAVDTTIRDCSYGAITVSNSFDVLLDGCSVHGIEGFGGVFTFYSSHDCAVINTLIRSCTSDSLVDVSSARGVYMAGCEVSRNSFTGMFNCTPFPLLLEGCAFRNNSLAMGWYQDSWQQSARVTDPSGNEYRDEDLETMALMADAAWTAPENTAAPVEVPEVSEDGMIHVTNVDQLLAAIAPNVTIYLEDGVYDLSASADYGVGSGDYWYWTSCFDGPGLVIREADHLRITAGGPHRARIVAVPRFCEVLNFENCRNVTLENFTAGHTQDLNGMTCAGGVVEFMGCSDVTVENCSLYGCGIVGVTCLSCRGVVIRYTEIHDCLDGAFYFYDDSNISVESCNVHDIDGYRFMSYNCRSITVDGRELPEGTW